MKRMYVKWTVIAMLAFGVACGDDDSVGNSDSGTDAQIDAPIEDDAGILDDAGSDDDDAGPDAAPDEDAGPADLDGDGFNADVDCNDDDPNVFPGATEVCDGVDTDCNDLVDDEASDAMTYYPDADGDGFGDPAGMPVQACEEPADHALTNTDCDDSEALVNPGATEVCGSELDEDCNPSTSCDGTCVDTADFTMCEEDASLPTPVVWLEYSTDALFADSGSEGLDAAEAGTAGSLTSIEGVVGEGIVMTGDSWVEGPSPLALPTANWTMATWVRLDEVTTGLDAMMSNGDGSVSFTGVLFLLNGEEVVEVTQSDTGQQSTVRTGQNVCLDAWAHVAMVYDAGTVVLYFNGEEVSRDTVNGSSVRWGSNPFSVGGDPHNSSRGIHAGMDDSRFYGESLNEAQVQALVRYGLCNRPTPAE